MAEIHKLPNKQRERWQNTTFFSFIFPILLSLLGITGTYTDFFFLSFVAHSHLDIYMKTDIKTPWFSDLFIIKGWCIYSVYGMQCSKVGLWKGAPFANRRYKRGVPLRSKLVFSKVWLPVGVAVLPRIKLCCVPPGAPPLPHPHVAGACKQYEI